MSQTFNQVCVGFAIFFAVVLFIVNVIFSFKYENYEFENNKFFLEITNSLNGKIIYSLSAKDRCDSNENQLILGEWDGSEEGCYCSSQSKVYNRECQSRDIKNGCTYVHPLSSKQYRKLNSKFLCIKNSEKTYLELLKTEQIVSKNSYCPVGYKSCGTIDTLENKFCTPSNEDCPINMNRINENFNLYLQNEYESYPIGYTSNNNLENQIISIIKISEDYPCIYPGEKSWYYNYDLESNKTCFTSIKGKIQDDRYEKMINYNTTKEDLYKDNNIISYGPPHGDIEKTVYLYGRSFLGFEKEKITKFSYDSIISVQNVSNNCGTVMRYLSTALLIFLSLPVLVVIVCVCGTGGHPPNCSGEECGCAFMACGIGGGITGVLAFVIDFILCIIIFICTIMIKLKLPSKVSDEYTNELIQLLLDEGSKNFGFSMAVICILVATLIPLVILLINCIRHGGELDF